MKKLMVITLFVISITLTGCGLYKEHEETKLVETESSFVEKVEVEEIEVEEIEVEDIMVSDEYLEELEFNSQQNVYFGER